MNKQEMIDFIYDKVSDKNFSNWCFIVYNPVKNWIQLNYSYITTSIFTTRATRDLIYVNPLYHYITPVKILRSQITKIIWHPVLIWNILEWVNFDEWLQPDEIFDNWGNKTKPIENQSIECITYIYNLIK